MTIPYIIGLMSGTSLDGCDAALIHIDEHNIHADFASRVRLLAFTTLPMPDNLSGMILDCCSEAQSNVKLVCQLNFLLGEFFANAALNVRELANVDARDILAIGSHGQTVFHIPQSAVGITASTLQIGEPSIIAARTGVTVVSNFRSADMAAGGRGAPLVPYAEYLLYNGNVSRALQNIGGIANVTVMPANASLDEVYAFDTGPGNMIIDSLTRRFFDKPYDTNGEIAAAGHVNDALLNHWLNTPYIYEAPPKATGRELFGEQFVNASVSMYQGIMPRDLVATATYFTAKCIEINYRAFIFKKHKVSEIILSGGGANKPTLARNIAELLPECVVTTQNEVGWDNDSKEAIAFALLAYETLRGNPSNVPNATGAARPVVLGSVTPSPNGWRGLSLGQR